MKDTWYEWTDEQEQAFRGFISKLISPPILRYPYHRNKFILTMNASNYGVEGGSFSRGNRKDLPITVTSRSLNKAE